VTARTLGGALDAFLTIALQHLPQISEQDAILRDVYGRLTLFLASPIDPSIRSNLASALQELAPYIRNERVVVVVHGEPGADDILNERRVQWIRVRPEASLFVRLIDRRVVGVDWLAAPEVEPPAGAKRFVFASMKGGVGRTTALCVAAKELAASGLNVLVLDLDLEAPGVGTMLTSELPRLGIADVLAGAALGIDFPLRDMIASSTLSTSTGGRIDVVPAYGTECSQRPEHYLGTLARALVDISLSAPRPVHTRVQALVDRLCLERSYDAVLIDARAGLAELTAGPMLTLGAKVFLFGTAQRQTFDDYRFLFAHLRSLVRPGAGALWKNLIPVLAKAGPDLAQLRAAQESMYELFASYFYEEESGLDDAYNFDADDDEAAHRFVPIAFDPSFATFDPATTTSHLSRPFYQAAFRPFLDTVFSLGEWGMWVPR
jgi:hypothetical protein